MSKYILFSIFCVFPFCVIVKSQNLIPNYSFEEFDEKGKHTMDPWNMILSVDQINYGRAENPPRTGVSFVGIRVTKSNYREFMQVELKSALEGGKKYYFELFVRPISYSYDFMTSIGVSLYKEQINYIRPELCKSNPPFLEINARKGIRSIEWMKVSDTIIAEGDEKFLTIGNFKDNPGSTLFRRKLFMRNRVFEAYYFFDDVSLYEIQANGQIIEDLPVTISEDTIKTQKKYDTLLNKTIILENILFKTNSSELDERSCGELNKLAEYLIQAKLLYVSIYGHTDNIGNEKSNLELSEKRAKSVAEYLVRSGVDISRINYKGFGSLHPISGNDTVEGRNKNRRVEFVLSKHEK